MEYTIYVQLLIIYAIGGFLLLQHLHLKKKIKKEMQEQDLAHKKSLAEAGNAITDTLKIAFDNLKKNANEHNKINGKITEHNSRIHRLEQNSSRTARELEKRDEIAEDDLDIPVARKNKKE